MQAVAVAICIIHMPVDQRVFPQVALPLERAALVIGWLWFINLYNFMDGIDGLAGTEAVAVLSAAERASLAGRVELHGLPSLTLSDAQFLRGETQGAQPVTVGAELRLAAAPGRQPVVVLIHGSGGMGSNVDLWARDFNAMGVATLAIDGFTGRGLVSTSTQQAALGRLNLILDAYMALALLAKHPRVDPQRVVLMGFSRGGQATLFASLKRFNEQWNRSGIRYAAYIPFYPDCMTQYQGDTELAGGPVRIHHGLADDYNPASTCQA